MSRKGLPAAHLIYGIPLTISSGIAAYFVILHKITKLIPDGGVELFIKSMLEFTYGTAIEINTRNSLICPSESEYLRNIILKNFGFFHQQARYVQTCGNDNKDYMRLSSLMSLFYAVSNDYSDIVICEMSEGKSFCEELGEGRFNLPTIYAIGEKKNQEALG